MTAPCCQSLKDRSLSAGSKGAITVGHSYSTLAWIPEAKGSWALPVCHERITSFETPSSRAAFQLKQVSRQLRVRPLAVYDRGYGNASFVNQTAQVEADLLLRLASNRCVYGAPPAYGGRGAPAKHGHKVKLNAPETWSVPVETLEVDEPRLGRVRVNRWSEYHFQKSPKRPMEIIRVEVLDPKGGKRRFAPLWLAWLGETMPPLEVLWLDDLRRKEPLNAKSQSNPLVTLTYQRLKLEPNVLRSTELNCYKWLSNFFISSARVSLEPFSPN